MQTVLDTLKTKPYFYGLNYWTIIGGAGNANEQVLDYVTMAPIGGYANLLKVYTGGAAFNPATHLVTNTGALIQLNAASGGAVGDTLTLLTTGSAAFRTPVTPAASITAATNKGAVYATGATTATSTAALTDGQVLVGSSAGSPAPATITAGTGITVTNAANAITLAVAASAATPRATLTFPTAGGANNGGTSSGAGTITHGFTGGAYTHAITGSGTWSIGQITSYGGGWAGNAFRNLSGTFSGNIYNNNGNGTVYIRFFYSGVAGSLYGDSYSARQIGFVATGGAVYAQCGDGTSGTSAALTGVNLVGNDVTITVAVKDGVSAKFSADGTLLVTHTTTLPDTTTPRKRVLMERVDDGNGSGTTLAIYGYSISYDA